MAQESEPDHHSANVYDTTVAPLLFPTTEDFAPYEGVEAPESEKVAGGAGLSTFIDVSEELKAGVLTPFYRFSPQLAFKAHVPIIWDRTLTYFDEEVSGGGLGDITLDAEYTRKLGSPGTHLRFSGSVKLPTGDDEKTVEGDDGLEYALPLGTGTTDFVLKGQYARSTASMGLVAGLMYRKNSPSESIQDWGGGDTATTETTNASQLIASAFARKRAGQSWWVHLGLSAMVLGDGKRVTEYSDGSPTFDWEANMGGTLVDVFPGVSYALGKLNPYLGMRIPLSTSYDNEFRDEERDLSVIFQFSYRPESLSK
jgi:hypothetical protein